MVTCWVWLTLPWSGEVRKTANRSMSWWWFIFLCVAHVCATYCRCFGNLDVISLRHLVHLHPVVFPFCALIHSVQVMLKTRSHWAESGYCVSWMCTVPLLQGGHRIARSFSETAHQLKPYSEHLDQLFRDRTEQFLVAEQSSTFGVAWHEI
jgi:hypothetical protein